MLNSRGWLMPQVLTLPASQKVLWGGTVLAHRLLPQASLSFIHASIHPTASVECQHTQDPAGNKMTKAHPDGTYILMQGDTVLK